MKRIMFFFFITILVSCARNEDPLRKVEFGVLLQNNFIDKMLSEGLISEQNEKYQDFRYYITDNNLKYPVLLKVNPDGFFLSHLREVEINLGSDTVFWFNGPSFCRGCGPALKTDVDKIYDIYKKWYGLPDSLITEYQKDYFSSEVDSTKPPISKIAKWRNKNFNLTFTMLSPELNEHFNGEYVYQSAFIKYTMLNYLQYYTALKDSIRKTLTPNEIISIDVYYPNWEVMYPGSAYDFGTKFSVKISNIHKIDRVEPRKVIAIRFDIVLSDRFNNELYRIKDLTYEPKEPLWSNESGSSYPMITLTYTDRYYKKNNDELESARLYSLSNTVQITADIRAIVFDDKSILSN